MHLLQVHSGGWYLAATADAAVAVLRVVLVGRDGHDARVALCHLVTKRRTERTLSHTADSSPLYTLPFICDTRYKEVCLESIQHDCEQI